jgi:hypothetical protein
MVILRKAALLGQFLAERSRKFAIEEVDISDTERTDKIA